MPLHQPHLNCCYLAKDALLSSVLANYKHQYSGGQIVPMYAPKKQIFTQLSDKDASSNKTKHQLKIRHL